MTGIRGIKVEWCDLCPRARCCKYKVKGIYVLSDSCPLSKWPNVTSKDLEKWERKIEKTKNDDGEIFLIIPNLKELLESIGVIIEEGK